MYTAGGANNCDTWLTIRSNVLNLLIYKMKCVTGGIRAAIIAASTAYFTSIGEATKALTQIGKEVHLTSYLSASYQKSYGKFLQLLQEKKYITDYHYA